MINGLKMQEKAISGTTTTKTTIYAIKF